MSLDILVNELRNVTRLEKEAKQKRYDLEESILQHPDIAKGLSESGTMNFLQYNMAVTTGLTESWDQERLNEIRAEWPEKHKDKFPFDSVWKPNSAKLRGLKEILPEAYDKLTPALTSKPKKPQFKFKDES